MTAFATQTVNNTAAIPLTTNNLINGTAITHVPGSTDIMLAPNQTYFATYELQAFIPSGGVADVQLQLNGILVGGTDSRAIGTPGDATVLTSSAVINTGAGPSILTLNNLSGQPLTLEGVNVNIIKLA
ncbi:hypothetical protein CN907_26950 [Bacillus anthracis]|nr:hypothetical protein CN907_26950 [Bacillus anthracis]